jgi:hypothetical protein
MAKFNTFKDWKENRGSLGEKKEEEAKTAPGNSELLALIEDLDAKRNEASRSNDGLGRQMYDIDIRVAKLEMQKNELLAKKKELQEAKNISEKKKRIPRSSHG